MPGEGIIIIIAFIVLITKACKLTEQDKNEIAWEKLEEKTIQENAEVFYEINNKRLNKK